MNREEFILKTREIREKKVAENKRHFEAKRSIEEDYADKKKKLVDEYNRALANNARRHEEVIQDLKRQREDAELEWVRTNPDGRFPKDREE